MAIQTIIDEGIKLMKQLIGTCFDATCYSVSQPEAGSVWISYQEVLSMFYHPTKKHTATTVGKLGQKQSVAEAGQWAQSQQTKAAYGNKAYYNTVSQITGFAYNLQNNLQLGSNTSKSININFNYQFIVYYEIIYFKYIIINLKHILIYYSIINQFLYQIVLSQIMESGIFQMNYYGNRLYLIEQQKLMKQYFIQAIIAFRLDYDNFKGFFETTQRSQISHNLFLPRRDGAINN